MTSLISSLTHFPTYFLVSLSSHSSNKICAAHERCDQPCVQPQIGRKRAGLTGTLVAPLGKQKKRPCTGKPQLEQQTFLYRAIACSSSSKAERLRGGRSGEATAPMLSGSPLLLRLLPLPRARILLPRRRRRHALLRLLPSPSAALLLSPSAWTCSSSSLQT